MLVKEKIDFGDVKCVKKNGENCLFFLFFNLKKKIPHNWSADRRRRALFFSPSLEGREREIKSEIKVFIPFLPSSTPKILVEFFWENVCGMTKDDRLDNS